VPLAIRVGGAGAASDAPVASPHRPAVLTCSAPAEAVLPKVIGARTVSACFPQSAPNHDGTGEERSATRSVPATAGSELPRLCIRPERGCLAGNHVLGEDDFLAADVREIAQGLRQGLIGYIKAKAAIRCLGDGGAEHAQRANSSETRCCAHPMRPNDHSTPSLVIVESPQFLGLTLDTDAGFSKILRADGLGGSADSHAASISDMPGESSRRRICRAYRQIRHDRTHEPIDVACVKHPADA